MISPTPVWFITAASSGFGHEIALSALRRGHVVVATARDPDKIKDLRDAGARTLAFDVTSALPDLEAVARRVFFQYQRVDYLVNAAGYILEAAVEEATPEEVYANFNTNVFGTMNTIRAFLPYIRAQTLGSNGRRAAIVTFGSLGSWQGGASYAVYAMTKSCASSLSQSLRSELSPFLIDAIVIEPGYFRTGFLNPSARVSASQRVAAYEDESTPSGQVRKALRSTDGNQPGDVKKGAEVCVDVLTRTGVAHGRELPPRLVLGSDCVGVIKKQCSDTLIQLDQWGSISKSTDY